MNGEGSCDWERNYGLNGRTLLGMVFTETFVFAFQIGDGRWEVLCD